MSSPVSISINNSYSQITGLTPSQYASLRQVLSYPIDSKQQYYSGGFRSRRYLLSKRGDFPSGLLHHVLGWIKKLSIQYHCRKNSVAPASPKRLFTLSTPMSPYPEQREAVGFAEEAERGCIVMPTGFGKSLTMALLVEAMQLKTLIIVPNLGLKEQLTSSFLKYFGSLDNVTIENIDSPRLKKATNYDMLIIDEAHHSAAKTYRDLNRKAWGGIYHRYFFTATPFRSKDEEQMLMESIVGEVIYRVEYKDAVKKGYIVPMEAYAIHLPKKEVQGDTWAEVYSELVVNNLDRNKVIKNLLAQLHEGGASTLCLVKEVAHGKAIQALTGGAFAHAQDEECEDLIEAFNSGAITTLVGTMGVMGEGRDTKRAEYILIAGLGKAKNTFAQNIGRGFRVYPGKESCKVILFYDPSHKWTRAHYREQCRILLDFYGIKPVKL